MIVERKSFSRLKKEGGGIFKAIHASASFQYGYPQIKIGSPLNFYVMTNGVLGDVALGKKVYISFENINNVTISNNNLVLDINEDGVDAQVVFKINNTAELTETYHSIRQYCNLGYKEVEINYPSAGRNERIEKSIRKSERQEKKERARQLKNEHIPYCPKCKSTSIQYVERRKMLSLGRGVVGDVIAGPMAGMIGAVTSKRHKGFVKCLNCGHTWKK